MPRPCPAVLFLCAGYASRPDSGLWCCGVVVRTCEILHDVGDVAFKVARSGACSGTERRLGLFRVVGAEHEKQDVRVERLRLAPRHCVREAAVIRHGVILRKAR
eukprot:1194992-Prorocentrum_minimum.AAC.13